MGRPSSLPTARRGSPSLAIAIGLAALAGGCRVVDARVSNLRHLHDADGSVKRVAAVEGDFQFVLRQILNGLSFRGGLGTNEPTPERLDDPYGTSLENVLALASAPSDDERVLGLQAELFSWLAVDCDWVLTRERAVLALGEVGRRLGLEDPSRPLRERQATQPEKALEWLQGLRAVLDPFLLQGGPAPSPAAVSEAVGAVDPTALDRDGARRLLRALNVWFESRRFGHPALEPLGELRRELARRSVELALAQSLSDPSARVRAAGLETCVEMTDNGLPRLLRAALGDELEVATRALRLLARYGLPPAEPEFADDAEGYRDAWIALVVRLLRVAPEGAVSVAGCRALARISDSGLDDLRPEVWATWWEARQRERAGAAAGGEQGAGAESAG